MKPPVFYYLPSGFYNSTGLWGVPLVTAVGGALAAVFCAFFFVEFNEATVFLFMIWLPLTSLVSARAVYFFKMRNPGIAFACAALGAFLAWLASFYVLYRFSPLPDSCAVYYKNGNADVPAILKMCARFWPAGECLELKNDLNLCEGDFFDFFSDRMRRGMDYTYCIGRYNCRPVTLHVNGAEFPLVWLLEATLFILGVSFSAVLRATRPFHEESDSWYEPVYLGKVLATADMDLTDRFCQGDIECLLTAPKAKIFQSGVGLILWRAPCFGATHYLRIVRPCRAKLPSSRVKASNHSLVHEAGFWNRNFLYAFFPLLIPVTDQDAAALLANFDKI